jgi:hypothetical protein
VDQLAAVLDARLHHLKGNKGPEAKGPVTKGRFND